jgi:hypothetical protein
LGKRPGAQKKPGGLAVKRRRGVTFMFLLCLAFTSGQVSFVSSGSLSVGYHPRTRQACGYNVQINVVPSLPAQDDNVQVTVSGDWYDTCIPSFLSHQIDNNVIRVDAVVDYPPGTGCADMITPWKFMEDIGELSPGSYEVALYITDLFNGVPTTLCATKSFAIFTELSKIYLPMIAK